ncbi:MAG: hypothetical protein JXR66_13080 [Bacteroidales bacterium]|nr:hypothetical protein [Bacteroidales bacterium]
MRKVISLLLIAIVVGSLITGCKKKPGDPPVLPPLESIAIDFSNFETTTKSADINLPKGVENSNWEFAALVAGYWRAVIFVTLAVPVYAFDHAIDQTPVYLDDKTWQWDYSVTYFTVTYKARLTGQIRTDDVQWKMYITREGAGGYNEFLWFEGTSDLDGKGGDWTLNHSATYQEPVLNIVWEGDGSQVTMVKYTYVRTLNDARTADPFKNSYIEYGKQTGTFDSYYDIHYYNGATFADMAVEWSSEDLNGRVMCQPFFGDNLWHCWDQNYINVSCE